MSLYPIHAYKKGYDFMIPQSCSYSEEYASTHCSWYLREVYNRDSHNLYRLCSCNPRPLSDSLPMTIQRPRCNQHRLTPVDGPRNSYEHLLYECRDCEKERGGRY